MRTTAASWGAFAKAHGVEPAIIIEARLAEHLSGLTGRLRRLASEVLLRLPEDWDSHAHWTMETGDIPSQVDHFLAGSRLVEADDDATVQLWQVILCESRLSTLSDAAVRGVIAHELGHVASALPSDPGLRVEAISEDRADAIARWWGFGSELEAKREENSS